MLAILFFIFLYIVYILFLMWSNGCVLSVNAENYDKIKSFDVYHSNIGAGFMTKFSVFNPF